MATIKGNNNIVISDVEFDGDLFVSTNDGSSIIITNSKKSKNEDIDKASEYLNKIMKKLMKKDDIDNVKIEDINDLYTMYIIISTAVQSLFIWLKDKVSDFDGLIDLIVMYNVLIKILKKIFKERNVVIYNALEKDSEKVMSWIDYINSKLAD